MGLLFLLMPAAPGKHDHRRSCRTVRERARSLA